MRNILIVALLLLSTVTVHASTPHDGVKTRTKTAHRDIMAQKLARTTLIPADTLADIAADTLTAAADSIAGKEPDTIGKKKRTSYWHRLFKGNEDHTFDKRFDVSFILSPSYTREASFGIGGLASGLYRLDRTDSLMKPSDVNIMGNISLSGLYVIAVGGNNYFKGNRSRLSYEISFANQPLKFWV